MPMNTSHQEIFSKLYSKKELAPFYIFNGKNANIEGNKVLENIIAKHFKINQENAQHRIEQGISDLLILDKKDDKKNYSIDDESLINFQRSLAFSPIELNYKIAYFKNAQTLTKVILNKLLKILEEPPSHFCIIFENASNNQFLETINSRAINIFCTAQDKNNNVSEIKLDKKEIKYLDQFLNKEKNSQEFIQRYRDKKYLHGEILKYFISKEKKHTYIKVNRQLELLKTFNTAQVFNRGTLELLIAYSQGIIPCDTLNT